LKSATKFQNITCTENIKIYHLWENMKMVAEISRKQYAAFCLKIIILVLEFENSLNRSWRIWHKPCVAMRALAFR
jgi:hypothetical protein